MRLKVLGEEKRWGVGQLFGGSIARIPRALRHTIRNRSPSPLLVLCHLVNLAKLARVRQPTHVHLLRTLPQEWVTAAATARYFGVSRGTVHAWIRNGLLSAIQFQASHYSDTRPRKTKRAEYRIHRDELQRFLAAFRSGRV